jgi:RND family efflux transporter MFP subunit
MWSRFVVASLLLIAPLYARADEVRGTALVKVEDPQQGSIPEIVPGRGMVEPENVRNQSFQRDGQVTDIMVEVGDRFKKGDALIDFGASPAAVIAYEQAKTALRLAEQQLERAQRMFKQKLATGDAVEAAEKALSDAKFTKEMYEKIGSINPREILEAPFDGVVVAIAVSKGDRVSAGTTLMTLAEIENKLRLMIGVEPSDLDKVKVGQEVEIGSPLPGRKPFKTKVYRVGASIDPKTRLAPVFVEVPIGSALPGEVVEAKIFVGEFRGWVIPCDAIGYKDKGPFVFQVDDEHAKRIYVEIVGSDGDRSVITGEINPDLKLVVEGNYQLDEGDPVRTGPQGEAKNQTIRSD